MAINYYDAAILQARMGVVLHNAYWLLDNCAPEDERLHAKIIKNAIGEMDDYIRAHLRPVTADEVDEVTDDEIDDDDDDDEDDDDELEDDE